MRDDGTETDSIGPAEMVELDRPEAFRLLARTPVGRVVYSFEALPAVRPVNFVLLGGDVAFRVRGDSVLAAAVDGNVVAFEADQLDLDGHVGWSVVVTGLAELMKSGDEYDRMAAEIPDTSAPGNHDDIVRIRVELVTGRRIVRGSANGR